MLSDVCQTLNQLHACTIYFMVPSPRFERICRLDQISSVMHTVCAQFSCWVISDCTLAAYFWRSELTRCLRLTGHLIALILGHAQKSEVLPIQFREWHKIACDVQDEGIGDILLS